MKESPLKRERQDLSISPKQSPLKRERLDLSVSPEDSPRIMSALQTFLVTQTLCSEI
jgi:hypothetical protein